jgi:hypothetical protein
VDCVLRSWRGVRTLGKPYRWGILREKTPTGRRGEEGVWTIRHVKWMWNHNMWMRRAREMVWFSISFLLQSKTREPGAARGLSLAATSRSRLFELLRACFLAAGHSIFVPTMYPRARSRNHPNRIQNQSKTSAKQAQTHTDTTLSSYPIIQFVVPEITLVCYPETHT